MGNISVKTTKKSSSILTDTKFLLVLICITLSAYPAFSQKVVETLGRGVVAARTGTNSVFVSWRMLRTDPTNIGFNLYRGSTKVNTSPIIAATNYVDNTSANEQYTVRPVLSGIEQAASSPASVWGQNFLSIPLQKPAEGVTPVGEVYDYSPNDASVADLDGDGEYEIVLKWSPSNAKDNSQAGYTGNVFIDAYKLNGTRLWRIDLGKNIRAGSHYTQFMVYDFDSDGKAEMAVKTAPNTKDATGSYLSKGPAAVDVDTIDYRTGDAWAGFIISGPEYLTVFNGETGAEMATVDYVPGRGTTNAWGNASDNTNRVDRFLAGVAYFDGQKPSFVMCRGYYGRSVLVAWDWRNGQLTQRWKFDSDQAGNEGYAGQGNHALIIADVDKDGKDEVVYGAMAVDDNGTGLYTTGLGHGDAMHAGDFLPDRPGLESWSAHECSGCYAGNGLWLRDAKTGERLWGVPSTGDIGRALSADIDPRYPGNEMWGAVGGLYSSTGKQIAPGKPSQNFAIWWDGDLLREILDKNVMDKWDYTNGVSSRLYTIYSNTGAADNNSTKATPGLSADILGDWREEMIFRHWNNQELLIITTTTPTQHKFYSLMQDLQYREAIAWQNVAYNQPPHPSFFLGADMNALLTDADKPENFIVAEASENIQFNKTIQSLSTDLASNSNLTFNKGTGPDWLTIAANGTLSGTPKDADKGVNLFTVQVLSGGTVTDLRILQVNVTDLNSPPVWSSATLSTSNAVVGYKLNTSIINEVIDPDSKISISKTSGAQWLTVSTNGTISGIPKPENIGENTFVVKATDEQGATAETTLKIQVSPLLLTNFYQFEDNTQDSEGLQHGVSSGSPIYQTGQTNKAITLDGVDDYITLPQGIVNYQQLTIATWVKWNGGNDYQRIFDIGDNTSSYMFFTPKTGTISRFAIRTAEVGEQYVDGTSLPIGEWKHVAITIEGTTAKLYIDGVLAGQNTALTLNPASLGKTIKNYIGKSQFADPLLNALLDDFRIYNYALSVNEILTLKNLITSSVPVLKSGKNATAIVGVPFEYITMATNKTTAYSATGLPTGTSINSTTGLITGTPTVAGLYPSLLQLTNSAGSAIDTVNITVKSNIVSGLKASPGDGKNVIEWSPLEGFSYIIKRSNSFDGPFTVLATVTTPSYTDATVTNGTDYYYVVASVYNSQELPNSDVIKATPNGGQHAYWKFDELSGLSASDSWGSNHATLQAGAVWAAGKFGNGIKLNGTATSYATLPTGIVSTLNDFTIGTWVKMDATSNWMRVFDFGTGTATNMFFTIRAGAANIIRYAIKNNNSAEQQLSYTYTVPVNTWTHFAITQSGNTCKLYLNGNLVATNTNVTFKPSTLGSTTLNYLGKAQYADPLLNGTIDEFRIYNRTLSDTEITTLYNTTVLPVTLVNFAAKLQKTGAVAVTWHTSAEINNNYYFVEKSTDGKEFFRIGNKIPSSGNQGGSYQLIDETPQAGDNYYRLSQVDKDGTLQVLDTKVAKVISLNKNSITIYPNPISGNSFTISIPGGKAEVLVKLSDLSGRILHQETVKSSSNGLYKVELKDRLPNGIYILNVDNYKEKIVVH